MQALYATPVCACCFDVFNIFALFFEGEISFYIQCMMHDAVAVKMRSRKHFLIYDALCMMQDTLF